MKRMAVFLDGTWQRLAQNDPSNIAKLAQSVAHEDPKGVSQIVHYGRGVGSAGEGSATGSQKLLAGITGEGLEDDIANAYMFLSWNYTVGDEIYIFGFSRGAYAARSLGGLIRKCGLLHRPHAEMVERAIDLYRSKVRPDDEDAVIFRKNYSYDPVPISYIGVFDTVGQRGVPTALGPIAWLSNLKYRFHDLNLSSLVKSARHACAIDEMRRAFPVTPWENLDELNKNSGFESADPKAPYQQRWFVGTHGEVGGGMASKLSNITMRWIAEGAAVSGLIFDEKNTPLFWNTGPDHIDPLYPLVVEKSLLDCAGKTPRRLKTYKRPAKPALTDIHLMLSDAALQRWKDCTPLYRPRSLKQFEKLMAELNSGAPPNQT